MNWSLSDWSSNDRPAALRTALIIANSPADGFVTETDGDEVDGEADRVAAPVSIEVCLTSEFDDAGVGDLVTVGVELGTGVGFWIGVGVRIGGREVPHIAQPGARGVFRNVHLSHDHSSGLISRSGT